MAIQWAKEAEEREIKEKGKSRVDMETRILYERERIEDDWDRVGLSEKRKEERLEASEKEFTIDFCKEIACLLGLVPNIEHTHPNNKGRRQD